ncbi:hypothetical protein Tcan_01891 [Toxocara canis]|uniref:Uncharacterized protein n=1 Tax=Toxocara canis TaxID=6265 RepID=A0A0B2V5R8_TOXCA|nr:hypothetical protein Tcan_01891 [Toxocara canis]
MRPDSSSAYHLTCEVAHSANAFSISDETVQLNATFGLRTLRDIKQAREEAEELLEAAGRIGTSSSSASLISVAQSASNPIGNLSPRQQW